MNNYAVARVFARIADLMEIQGQEFYKIRAYRNAAQVMQELTESLEVLAERGELKNIPGVGEAIAAKTRDILQTGTTSLYERLKEEVPESLTTLLPLPQFGPKKIQAVWKELGVRNLDELEEAARDQRLRAVPGMGEKTEATVLRNIEAYRKRKQNIPVFQAYPYAELIARQLRETGKFTRVEVAGSLRRMQDIVHDIHLAGAAEDPAAALEAFLQHPEVLEVLERTDNEAAVETHSDRRLALRVCRPEEFGALLVSYTGSEEHVRQLDAVAAQRGESVTPCAVREVDSGRSVSEDQDEAQIYRGLGLPWIAPELREGRGEVEAALRGELPRLIEQADIRGILHAHSTWSDGLHTIARMAEAAHELGYLYHAVTDHSKALAMVRGLNEEKLVEQAAEIAAVNATFTDGFRVLRGIECDILVDGEMDLSLDSLRQLDVVVASVHSHQRQDEETITQRVIRALETGVIDILAHPTGRILGMRDPSALDLEWVIDAAAANQVALEINAYPDRLDLNDVWAKRARDKGVLISINTDAHKTDHLSMLRYGIAQARRAWLEPEQVINCWPLDRLLAWLHDRRG